MAQTVFGVVVGKVIVVVAIAASVMTGTGLFQMKTLLMIFLILVLSSWASPPHGHAYDNYGAIAYSKSSDKWGTAYNYSSRADAERSARGQCGRGE